MLRHRFFRSFLPVLLFSSLGFLAMGYHPGSEDDGIYLTGVKADLNPALYPHDAPFFQLQMRSSVFCPWMARFVHLTGLPLAWAALLLQAVAILLIVWGCWSIVCELFEERAARWGALAMVTAMFTLPVSATALYLVDQHLHPRSLATAMILFGVSRVLAGKYAPAALFLALGFVFHPLMGALGISFCCFLALTKWEPLHRRLRLPSSAPLAALIPFGWVFDPPSPTWLEALHSRHWFRLYQWEWYEWLGAIGPLVLLWLVARLARRQGEVKLARFAWAVVLYGIFQQAVSMVILGPQRLIGLSALEPMRYLHLIYVFLTLIGGAYAGKYLLKARLWRWTIFFAVTYGSMFLAQRQLFASSEHFELPGRSSGNAWLEAFDWIRLHTPVDAYFVVGPKYMAAEGEDYHGFRALAERSQLADAIKDTSMITKEPELGPEWKAQVTAQQGWDHFERADFERLKRQFGVDWALVAYPQPLGLDCPWHNRQLAVCRIR